MPLKIFLSSTLRKYLPNYNPTEGTDFSVHEELTVAELCKRMEIPIDSIKIVMVNGRNEGLDYVLRGDERVGLFPPVGGG